MRRRCADRARCVAERPGLWNNACASRGPPLQGRVSVGYEPTDWFFRTEVGFAGEQDRLGAFETVTEGYAVVGIAAGVRLTLGGRLNVITATLENVTNEEYRNHLSRVKDIMPEAGRGLSLTYRVVF